MNNIIIDREEGNFNEWISVSVIKRDYLFVYLKYKQKAHVPIKVSNQQNK